MLENRLFNKNEEKSKYQWKLIIIADNNSFSKNEKSQCQ